jgi:putative aldouronate transport system permease protein
MGLLNQLRRNISRDRYLLLIIVIPVIYFIVFQYLPMYGLIIAFKDFRPLSGILGSPWAGFKHFEQFFHSVYLWRLLKNTILLSIYSLIWGFPIPIIFALLVNELRDRFYKKFVQTVSYLPHFISVVVVTGMLVTFLAQDGVVNMVLSKFGIDPIVFLNESGLFRSIYVSSGVWQSFGWGSIIYLAAMAGINPQLYEAAAMDGAKRWHRIRHITLPGIMPTIIILLILNVGSMLEIGFEKVILLYNPTTYVTADIIQTYVYRRGILSADFSYGAAIGLINNVINLCILVIANTISRRVSDTSLW